MGQTDYEIFKERGLFGLKEGGNKVRPVLIGLSYFKTYQVDEFKTEYGIDRIQVKRDKFTKYLRHTQLFHL